MDREPPSFETLFEARVREPKDVERVGLLGALASIAALASVILMLAGAPGLYAGAAAVVALPLAVVATRIYCKGRRTARVERRGEKYHLVVGDIQLALPLTLRGSQLTGHINRARFHEVLLQCIDPSGASVLFVERRSAADGARKHWLMNGPDEVLGSPMFHIDGVTAIGELRSVIEESTTILETTAPVSKPEREVVLELLARLCKAEAAGVPEATEDVAAEFDAEIAKMLDTDFGLPANRRRVLALLEAAVRAGPLALKNTVWAIHGAAEARAVLLADYFHFECTSEELSVVVAALEAMRAGPLELGGAACRFDVDLALAARLVKLGRVGEAQELVSALTRELPDRVGFHTFQVAIAEIHHALLSHFLGHTTSEVEAHLDDALEVVSELEPPVRYEVLEQLVRVFLHVGLVERGCSTLIALVEERLKDPGELRVRPPAFLRKLVGDGVVLPALPLESGAARPLDGLANTMSSTPFGGAGLLDLARLRGEYLDAGDDEAAAFVEHAARRIVTAHAAHGLGDLERKEVEYALEVLGRHGTLALGDIFRG